MVLEMLTIYYIWGGLMIGLAGFIVILGLIVGLRVAFWRIQEAFTEFYRVLDGFRWI